MKGKVQDIKDIIESPKTKLWNTLYGPTSTKLIKTLTLYTTNLTQIPSLYNLRS